ncbi:peptidoglycan-associated lipoprotein Pal [Denitratisoma oestradiolicum]|uniref:Peptidoglycan-associated lipoprotein n=1 Tax=Denitratisoma oestradiolicum TaxID=311182 RepID=A0A6S6Y240_9PROT|nr:peptidoglycan-associated lipoprotein Pal [Denitratisoma oestradiolicum]TWO81642.1 peptidoglycan-associated lipoprotein [Denitratisoma oestradiolicum]CAB1370585.1 Peptidoglycan-associated protein [Denitratisoma oestradiolicum]
MRNALVLAALAASLLAACSSQPPAPEQKPAPVAAPQPAAQPMPVTQDDPNALTIANLKNPKSILSKREVFFDYDQYVVKPEFKALIEAHARFLAANPTMKMLIQGNADERGSREYNLALGQKRAEAVKKALLLLGGREDQVEAVSLGEEKPRCTSHDEDCWYQNRRDDILYSGEY